MTSNEIRQKYLDFFASKGHTIVPSAPIVLKDDPTLMFSNSGMTQFKDYFLGYKAPSSPRIADSQKCLRVSGKHNDLDDVGRDTYHHTMFEMLGNWSFGDYFKKEAIDWAWELLTKEYGISKDDIYVTVFEGDTAEDLARDHEAFDYWLAHVSQERILNGNKKDNFWEMGESGPCGPCSEIHLDLRTPVEKALLPGSELVNQDHPQVIEIWNLVFMEYNRKADGSLEKLPAKHVDTGMGFERLCMALQGKTSNYDTDVFTPLIDKVAQLTGKQYEGILQNDKDTAIRVVVDHIRAVAFAIADGQLPSNTGAGYVIRRILRRAISYSYRFLKAKEPVLFELVEVLATQMGSAFPELVRQQKLISEVVREEEQSFLKTIETGLVRLDHILKETVNLGSKVVSGEAVFELYDTYGFPADLSRIIAEEKSLSIDQEGFEAQMQLQKQRSKKDSKSKVFDWVILENAAQNFVGYDQLSATTQIARYRKVENKDGEFYQIVLTTTPFYPEGGGQVGDNGILIPSYAENFNIDHPEHFDPELSEEVVEVLETRKENNLIISLIKTLPKDPGAVFYAQVKSAARTSTQSNHSATHLLHQALREVLGTHVEQKGSYVGPDYLRFDFSHFSKITPEQMQAIENLVNEKIQSALPLEEFRDIPLQEALSKGAMALFGEKYGDSVRMIQFGSSMELCGGTHVGNTSEIGAFKILAEASAAAGIRRIEAISGGALRAHHQAVEKAMNELSQMLKSKDVLKAVEKLQSENTQLRTELDQLKKEQTKNVLSAWSQEFTRQEDKNLLVKRTSLDSQSVKDIVFTLKSQVENALIVVVSDHGGKPLITVGVSASLEATYAAGSIVKTLSKEIQGGGGGNAGFATAGGKDLSGIERVVEKARLL